MPSNRAEEFCQTVCTHIRSKRAREQVRQELLDHIEDHILDCTSRGIPPEQAEQEAVDAMGDPDFLGVELNRQHSPWLDWAVTLTNLLAVLALVFSSYLLATSFFSYWSSRDYQEPAVKVVASQKLDLQGELDTRTVFIERISVTEEGDLLLFYRDRVKSIFVRGWSLQSWNIFDEKGREYLCSTSGNLSSFGGAYVVRVEDFDPQATKVLLKYQGYNRDLHFTISVPGRNPL